MPAIPPNSPPIAITPALKLQPAPAWRGDVRLAPKGGAVLGEEAPSPIITAPLQLFTPAEPAIVLDIQAPPTTRTLADESADGALEYQPTAAAVYVLLHEVHTPDGVIYDVTLPQRGVAAGPRTLGDETPPVLRFPIHPVAGGSAPGAHPRPRTLGLDQVVGDAIADVVIKRVLQVLRSPLDRGLLAAVRRFEPQPRVYALRDAGFQPLEGAESWRALLPPGANHRVVLYIHGFGSSTAGSEGGKFVPALAANYDAVLGYDHPSATRSPLENARTLIEMIPEDLRLNVDLVAHSRGGLVARSLIELADWQPQLQPRRLVTAGSPHAGTRLAEPERWDRLVSVGLTLGSWLSTLGGGGFWAPQLLEFVLKAAAQSTFDLPGIAAMTPGGDFLKQLNAANPTELQAKVPYAAITSSFAINDVVQQGFRQAFTALAMQAFMGEPNDLVVHTASALAIDVGSRIFTREQQLRTATDHSSYYKNAEVQAFVRQHLGSA